MDNKDRISNAFNATRALCIPDEKVKPVLKRLLRVFNYNWEPIEEEDYRVLIDAYFEVENKDTATDRPSKRPHFSEPEQKDSSVKDGLKRSKTVEDGELSTSVSGQQNKVSPQPRSESRRDRRTESNSLMSSSCTLPRDCITSQMAPKVGNPTHEKTSYASSSRQPIVAPHTSHHHKGTAPLYCHNRELTKPRTGRVVNDSADFAQPSAMVVPGASNLASQCDTSGSKDIKHSKNNFPIASSSLGEVKLLLSCNSASGKPKFQLPDFNAVVKALEDKYIRVRKLAMPEFSVITLLKDLCEKYVRPGGVAGPSSVPYDSSLEPRKASNSLHSQGQNRRPFTITDSFTAFKRKSSNSGGFSDSCNLIKAQHKTNSCDWKRSICNINDITKGTENVKISLMDEVGDEDLPKFTYMPHNVIYQDACMQISLARIADVDCCSGCSGDCLSQPIPCACAHETGGVFAYTKGGLLKDEFLTDSLSRKQNPREDHFVFCHDCPLERSKYPPERCKGHLVRKFIKECWVKCGCNLKCGNRVVQRGITCKLQVFFTNKGKGWGVRTLEDLPQGSFVCEYVGEILTNTELYFRNKKNSGSDRHTYPVTLDADWGSEKVLKDHEALCLDATSSGNVARFINHRCGDANLIDIPVQVETLDKHYYHLAFFTTRKVTALEELTWDYGIDFDDYEHPIKAFQCCCGSALCRQAKQKSLVARGQ